MAEKLDPKEIVSLEEVLLANELQDEALVNLLFESWIKKGRAIADSALDVLTEELVVSSLVKSYS